VLHAWDRIGYRICKGKPEKTYEMPGRPKSRWEVMLKEILKK
jgi:hypothetical protein